MFLKGSYLLILHVDFFIQLCHFHLQEQVKPIRMYTDTKELHGHSKNKNYGVIGDYFRHVRRKPETKFYKESKWCKYKELEGKIEKDLE